MLRDLFLVDKAGRHRDKSTEERASQCAVILFGQRDIRSKSEATNCIVVPLRGISLRQPDSAPTESSWPCRRRNRQMRLALWIDNKKPVRALAGAFRLDAGQIAKREMEQTPLSAVLRRKGVGRAGLANLFSGHFGGHAQFLRTQRLEVACIEADEIVFARIKPQHLRRDGFEGSQ